MPTTSYLGAGTAASVARTGGTAWTNPTNAQGSATGGGSATVISAATAYLRLSNYGFSVPATDDIVGIQIKLGGVIGDFGTPTDAIRFTVEIVGPAGTVIGTAKTHDMNSLSGTHTWVLGGADDLWGTTGLTGADVNDTDFGIRLWAAPHIVTGNYAINVDGVEIRVTHESTLIEGTSTLTLPFPIMSASGKQALKASGSLVLPFPILSATGQQAFIATAALTLPFPIMSAMGTFTPATFTGTAGLVLPFPIMNASGRHIISGDGSFTLPFPIMQATGVLLGATGGAVLTLPFPILRATGLQVKVGSSTLTLPFPIMRASGIIYAIGQAQLTLPFPIMVAQGFLILPTHVVENLVALPNYSAVVRIPNYDATIPIPEIAKSISVPDTETLIPIPDQSAVRSL